MQFSPQEHHEAHSLEPNCHFSYFANGLTVSNLLLLFKETLFFAHLK